MQVTEEAARRTAVIDCLLGTAVGDALGLPCEGLSRQRQRRMYPNIGKYHFLFGRGMVSDDTEHTCMVAQALIVSGGDPARFQQSLARRMRAWLLGLPAGVGLATLKAVLKLSVGVPPQRSGVYSAGNGPAMRSALIGVCYGHEPERLRELVRASTRLTHTDPKAEYGALAVALAAALASTQGEVSPQSYLKSLAVSLPSEAGEFLALVTRAVNSACAGQSTETFAAELGLPNGVTGYVYHTVPVVIQAWLRHQGDFEGGVTAIIRCGGDTDTTAAILGAILGASVGKAGIPQPWLDNLWEWPRSKSWMERLAGSLASGTAQPPLSVSVAAIPLRNLVFLLVVLTHGLRRLLPPY